MPTAKKTPARKTAATSKKVVTKKPVAPKKSIVVKKNVTQQSSATAAIGAGGLSNSAIMGLLHLVGGILGSRGWLAVIIYYIIKKESFSAQDTDIFYNIVNFNLSFLLYGIISAMLVVILIGIPMLAIVTVTYVVLLIISSFNYISDKSYKIPFSIQILK